MKLCYPACFYQDAETGNYTVEIPDLPGCVTGGPTLPEAILMAEDAASGWILDELEDGKPVPPATPIQEVTPDAGGFVSALALDMEAYAKKYGNTAVRKNCTIPAWLNTFAEARHINLSKVLTDGLTALYQASISI